MQHFLEFLITSLAFGYHVAALNLPQDPTITPAPIVPKDLFKRDVATCGWIRGNSASPITCQSAYSCVLTGKYASTAWACCNDIECLGNWNKCADQAHQICSNYDLSTCSSLYGSILSCSGANPSCFRYARSSSLGASSTWYSLACGQASTDVLVLATVTGAGEKISSASASANTDLTVFGGSSPTETSTSNSGGTSSGQSSATTSITSPNNIWKIIVACAVVGGVLIVSGIIAVYCRWRSQKPKIKRWVDPRGPGSAAYQQTLAPSTVKNWVNGLTSHPPPPASIFGGRTMYDRGMSEHGRG